ncbi:MAG TPA: hypothetical protein VHD56_16720 [Tepidisphaeraceae bacterium]|nr:hypothetical protein [Tepidisphaeraceae bacterium]
MFRPPTADVIDVLQPMPRQVQSLRGVLWACLIVGMVLRLGLSAVSQGSNDAATWERFGHQISEHGLIEAYRIEDTMNHPPLPLLWAQFSTHFGERARFAFVMKLPAILADAGTILLLYSIWQKRSDARRTKLACIGMAISPVAILVGAYHCNTDNVYAFLTLLAMHLLWSVQSFFWGGLVIAAAINVKLVPILLIPVAFSLCRNRMDALKVLAGLAFGVIPFLIFLQAPDLLLRNLLKYAPPISEWGVPYFLHSAQKELAYSDLATVILQHYLWIGRWSIVVIAILLGITSRIWRHWNGYELSALVYSTMLVLAPGFGVQYTVIVVPSLLAMSIWRSWLYGILGGLFLLLIYWAYLVPDVRPFYSSFGGEFPMPGPLFGLLAWWLLLQTMLELIPWRPNFLTED